MHPSTKNSKTESLKVLVGESLSAFYNNLMASGHNTPHSLVVAATRNEHCHFVWVTFIWLRLPGSLGRIGTSPTSNSPVASRWRANRAKAWLSGLEIVNALHIEFCWLYKRDDRNKHKQFKKCQCDSVAFGNPSPTCCALTIALLSHVLPSARCHFDLIRPVGFVPGCEMSFSPSLRAQWWDPLQVKGPDFLLWQMVLW